MQPRVSALVCSGCTKRFGNTLVFRGIDFRLHPGESLAVTGPNGSGKSTLLEICARVQSPSAGEVRLMSGEETIGAGGQWNLLGLASARVSPYGELTGAENIEFAIRARGLDQEARVRAGELLDYLGLHRHRDKQVKHYSSGMRQRLGFLLAVLHDPPVLLLDEPTAHLDAEGGALICGRIERMREGRILLIATNDESEAGLCAGRLRLA
jgi:heme exporter protein A